MSRPESVSAIENGDKNGDAFVTASISDARTLLPILASDSASAQVAGLIFSGLVKYDKDLRLTGDLAESWEIKDDGKEILFHLRKGVRWHDGVPFTSRDVEFTFNTIIDPDVPTPYSGDFKKVKALEILDEHTIRVTYSDVFAPALSSWSMPIMPRHLLEKEDLLKTEFARSPVGTGPYKFVRWRSKDRIDLDANDQYFEHRPHIDRCIYRVIPDNTTMFLELETGNVDAMTLSPIQFSKLTDTKAFLDKFSKFRYPSFGYVYMGYNLKNKFFKDKNTRIALNLAVDKKEIIDGVLIGLGVECTGPFLPGAWAYDIGVKPADFSPDKAREMLKTSGYSDVNGDGWLEKDGSRFEFTLLTNQGNAERVKTAEIIQKRLEDIGVKMNIRVVEWSVLVNEFVNKKDFDAVLMGWSLTLDPDCNDIWHSSKTRPGEFNFVGYSDPEVDRLLDEGRGTFDVEKRRQAYNGIHRILYADQPYMFLYVPDSLVAVSKRFRNVKVEPVGLMYNFIDWYVPEREQRYAER